jgi:Reverse transcriptase (RNA-dependent DNA polymerase)
VAENKAKYTVSDYQRAEKARTIQRRIGRPSTSRYMELATKGRIKNCDVTRQDIINAEDIFGPERGSLKGKTVRKASDQVRSGGLVPIPAAIMAHYQKIVLYIDVMKVNNMPFLVTISRAIKFGTVAWLKNVKAETILNHIKDVRNVYVKRGFILEVVEVDGQFEPLRGALAGMGVTLNKCSRDEHVPVAERRIRTLKERCRSICNTLPFTKLPPMLTVQMVSTCNFWLNVYPPKDGVSRNINPRELITGVQIDFNKHIRAEFGEYVQVHEEHDNSMKTRTTGAIATKPTGNAQGGHWFYSLTTGRMLDRTQWTPLPMPADVIERVTFLGRTSPIGMNFTDLRNVNYDDDVFDIDNNSDDDDSDYDSDDEPSDDDDDDYDDFIAGVDRHADLPDPPDENADENNNSEEDDEEDNDDNVPDLQQDEESESDDDYGEVGQVPEDPPAPAEEQAEQRQPNLPAALKKLADYTGALPQIMGTRTRQHNSETLVTAKEVVTEEEWNKPLSKKQRKLERDLKKRMLKRDIEEAKRKLRNKLKNEKKRKGKKNEMASKTKGILTQDEPEEFLDLRDQLKAEQKPGVLFPHDSCSSKDLTPDLEAIALTQYNLKRGLKEFGNDGLVALGKEMNQLYTRKVSKPVHKDDLTKEQKKASLRYLMFLTKKRCGKIKARGCADGRKQRETINKEDASAPTISIEAVMLSATIDAMEGRDVATVDIPGAFMQADIDEVVHVKFEGELAEILVKLDPKLYRKYVTDENGKSVLYVELLKALYGTLKAALLFWKLLSNKLISWGFVINPYDWCVANKMIDGKQCTIGWHVDDLKISHVDPKVNDIIIGLINNEFGQEAPITVTRGKEHDYLGMTLDYTAKGKVKVKMHDYIVKMLTDLPVEFDGEAPTPAANNLFDVDENSPKVDEKRAQFFHTYVAKTLFLCKRARPDLQTTVSFLCKRVKECTEDDWKKLKRMLQFIRATKDDYLTLSATSLHNVRWWVDASYAVHPDMKSHTGGAMSLGRGVIYGTSKSQKLNTKSSTEAELVGTDDVMPQMLWTLYFLEAQGYKIDNNILYQDNKSSILLETNGRGSSGKRTRHINVRYFFIADRVKSGEIRIEHCPTGIMIADYFTKALQGATFWRLRDMIMGNTEIALPNETTIVVPDPSVGILDSSTIRESRSVLKDEIASSSSQQSLTVLHASGRKQGGKTEMITGTTQPVMKKPTVTWADVVRLRKDE